MPVKQLPQEFERKSFGTVYIHKQVLRKGVVVLHEISDDGLVVGWEVGKVFKYPYPLGKINESGDTLYEKRWKDEDFGKNVWYYSAKTDSREKALERFNSLIS